MLLLYILYELLRVGTSLNPTPTTSSDPGYACSFKGVFLFISEYSYHGRGQVRNRSRPSCIPTLVAFLSLLSSALAVSMTQRYFPIRRPTLICPSLVDRTSILSKDGNRLTEAKCQPWTRISPIDHRWDVDDGQWRTMHWTSCTRYAGHVVCRG
jgi:hypothetical protein